jgi:Rrf2 family protein
LARLKKGETVSLAWIAKSERISLAYLERLFSALKKAGVVEAVKGVSGGYHLARSADKTSVYDVVKVLEGKMSAFHCIDETGKIVCSSKCKCGATKVLAEVQSAVHSSLKKLSLKDLI